MLLIPTSLAPSGTLGPEALPGHPDNGGRCDHCPLDQLDRALNSEPGTLLQRPSELEHALRVGVTLSLDDVAADELWAMRAIKEERERYDCQRTGISRVPTRYRKRSCGRANH